MTDHASSNGRKTLVVAARATDCFESRRRSGWHGLLAVADDSQLALTVIQVRCFSLYHAQTGHRAARCAPGQARRSSDRRARCAASAAALQRPACRSSAQSPASSAHPTLVTASMATQQALQAFVEARAADLAATQAYVGQLVAARGWTAPDDAQLAALASTALLAVAINVLLMLLVPKGRKLVFDTVETVLAIALIVVLLAVVLGLPLGERRRRRRVGRSRLLA